MVTAHIFVKTQCKTLICIERSVIGFLTVESNFDLICIYHHVLIANLYFLYIHNRSLNLIANNMECRLFISMRTIVLI